MNVSSLNLSKYALIATLLVVPFSGAFAQAPAVPADTVVSAPVNSAVSAALQVDLVVLIGRTELQASTIADNFSRETDVNRPQSAAPLSASASADPDSTPAQYIQLTKTAGTELSAQNYAAAANDFVQAAALYPGRTAAQLRAAIALALAGDEDKASTLASELEIIGSPAICQASGSLLEAIQNAKDTSIAPQPIMNVPADTPAPDPAPAVVAPAPADPAPVADGPTPVDTLNWIVGKLDGLPNHFTSGESADGTPGHIDDFNYGFVQNLLVVSHKRVWKLPSSVPILTTETITVDFRNIASVSVDQIPYGTMAGAYAISITTAGQDISLHEVVKDVDDPWNVRSNSDTTKDVSSYRVFVVSDADLADRIAKAISHIIDLNAGAPHHDIF